VTSLLFIKPSEGCWAKGRENILREGGGRLGGAGESPFLPTPSRAEAESLFANGAEREEGKG